MHKQDVKFSCCSSLRTISDNKSQPRPRSIICACAFLSRRSPGGGERSHTHVQYSTVQYNTMHVSDACPQPVTRTWVRFHKGVVTCDTHKSSTTSSHPCGRPRHAGPCSMLNNPERPQGPLGTGSPGRPPRQNDRDILRACYCGSTGVERISK